MEWDAVSPRPVPRSLVEKKGSKTRRMCSGAMPGPSSATEIAAYRPGASGSGSPGSTSTFRAPTRILPPAGMA